MGVLTATERRTNLRRQLKELQGHAEEIQKEFVKEWEQKPKEERKRGPYKRREK